MRTSVSLVRSPGDVALRALELLQVGGRCGGSPQPKAAPEPVDRGRRHRGELEVVGVRGRSGAVPVHEVAPQERVGHEEGDRSEEHTSELQSLMRNSYAVFCLKKKNNNYSII